MGGTRIYDAVHGHGWKDRKPRRRGPFGAARWKYLESSRGVSQPTIKTHSYLRVSFPTAILSDVESARATRIRDVAIDCAVENKTACYDRTHCALANEVFEITAPCDATFLCEKSCARRINMLIHLPSFFPFKTLPPLPLIPLPQNSPFQN